MDYPTEFQKKTLWNAATGVSILILGLLLVGLIWLTGRVFGFLQPVLIPLIVAGIVAYVMDPVVNLLQRRGMNRIWSVIVIYMMILCAMTLLVVAIVPGVKRAHNNFKEFLNTEKEMVVNTEDGATEPIAAEETTEDSQLTTAMVRELRELQIKYPEGPVAWALAEIDDNGAVITLSKDEIQTRTLHSFAQSRAGRLIYQYKGAIYKTAKDWITTGSSRILGFIGLVLGMIMVPVYLFFFLKDSDAIRKHWHDYVPLKASRFKTELVETLSEINGYLISFFRGQVLVAVIDGILVGIALTLFGLPYGFIIGIFMAILGVIPYIGNIICLIPACIIAYLHAQGNSAPFDMSPWSYVACVLAIFVVVQQINSLVTAPKIVGDSVGLHPLTVIFSMLFWSLVLGGFIGALLAVPLTAAIKVLFRRFIWVRRIKPTTEAATA